MCARVVLNDPVLRYDLMLPVVPSLSSAQSRITKKNRVLKCSVLACAN